MMWYGRVDFMLKPGKSPQAAIHGQKMTLQAILMADALKRDKSAYKIWAMLYKATVYFGGRSDDLDVADYIHLIEKVFPTGGTVDKYSIQAGLSEFIAAALKLRQPRILSAAAFVENAKLLSPLKVFASWARDLSLIPIYFNNLSLAARAKRLFLDIEAAASLLPWKFCLMLDQPELFLGGWMYWLFLVPKERWQYWKWKEIQNLKAIMSN